MDSIKSEAVVVTCGLCHRPYRVPRYAMDGSVPGESLGCGMVMQYEEVSVDIKIRHREHDICPRCAAELAHETVKEWISFNTAQSIPAPDESLREVPNTINLKRLIWILVWAFILACFIKLTLAN